MNNGPKKIKDVPQETPTVQVGPEAISIIDESNKEGGSTSQPVPALVPPTETESSVDNSVPEERPQNKYLKPFVKGQSGNPNGRPKGLKNFETVFTNALFMLAEQNDQDAEQMFLEVVANGIKQAREGNFKYYTDLMNRLYGKALQPMDLTTNGDSINQPTTVIFKDYSKGDEQPDPDEDNEVLGS
jgi:hypothetical protein